MESKINMKLELIDMDDWNKNPSKSEVKIYINQIKGTTRLLLSC